MTGKIFINYRRGDDPGNTGRLFDQLEDVFPREQLFIDVDSIPPGRDFVRVLEEQVAQCDVLIAVIGKGWLDARDEQGVRRLDNPDDFVRIEIESALKLDKVVIPVLVQDARMPRADELPDALKPLARRNAVRLTHERFKAETQALTKAIQQLLDEVATQRGARAEAMRKAQADDDRKVQEEAARRRAQAQRGPERAGAPTRRRLVQGMGAAVGVAALAGGIFWLQPQRPAGPVTQPPSQPPPPAGPLIRTFLGHTEPVRSVAFSPDGRTAVSGSNDATLKLWEVATGNELRTLKGDTNGVNSIAFSPDGRNLLSGSADGTLRLWEVATGKELRRFKGDVLQVISAAFSPDGSMVLCSGLLTTLWNLASEKELYVFPGLGAFSVAFSPDGRTVLLGHAPLASADRPAGGNGTLVVREVATGKELLSFGRQKDTVLSVAFSPDGRTVLSGSSDQTLILWQIATGKELRDFRGHLNRVTSVAFSPDGRTALSGSADNTLKLWDVATGRDLHTLTGHSSGVNSVAFSPDGRAALSGSTDKTLKLWDLTGL